MLVYESISPWWPTEREDKIKVWDIVVENEKHLEISVDLNNNQYQVVHISLSSSEDCHTTWFLSWKKAKKICILWQT